MGRLEGPMKRMMSGWPLFAQRRGAPEWLAGVCSVEGRP